MAAKKDKVTISTLKGQSTVRSVVESLVKEFGSDLAAMMGTGLTDPRANVLFLKNGVEISVLHGLDTGLEDEDELALIPVVHGG